MLLLLSSLQYRKIRENIRNVVARPKGSSALASANLGKPTQDVTIQLINEPFYFLGYLSGQFAARTGNDDEEDGTLADIAERVLCTFIYFL